MNLNKVYDEYLNDENEEEEDEQAIDYNTFNLN